MQLKFPIPWRSLIFAGAVILAACPGLTGPAGTGELSPPTRSLADLEPRYRASVVRGWRSFQTSFARDGMTCVDCHRQPEELLYWARAYPKVEVFDGTPYRVKGLGQVVLEVLEKHTDLPGAQRAGLAEDLVAFIAWKGEGQSLRPGFSKTFPPAPADLAELDASWKRGEALFNEPGFGPCAQCHSPEDQSSTAEKIALGNTAATFPGYVTAARGVLSLETFLARHLAGQGLGVHSPQSQEITDLAAYLAKLSTGKRMRPGRLRTGKMEKP